MNVVSYGSLIEKYQLKEVDILMIDAEGYDYEAVSMFPYETLLPKAVIFEYKHLSKSLQRKLQEMLEERGYLPFFTKNDALFIHVKK
ncbi:MAG: FkbM family methyltransferase [Gammaproteobacteria bacterium]|nr:FkbM family methyltransferase [Gammaproteobacteria bacterium]